MTLPNDTSDQWVIDAFRTNGGRVGGPYEGTRLLLLTTADARSGAPRTTALSYLLDGGERNLVFPTRDDEAGNGAGGPPNHPAWLRDVSADPRVKVEDGILVYDARAHILRGEEHHRALARAQEVFAEARGPIVALQPTSLPRPVTTARGQALKLIHDAFRRELVLIRKEITESGTVLGVQLRVNCLTVCQGLRQHHNSEEAGTFRIAVEQSPELSVTLDRLRQEHREIAALLDDLQAAVSRGGDRRALLSEVERLTLLVEKHLSYEEEHLIPALDAAAQ